MAFPTLFAIQSYVYPIEFREQSVIDDADIYQARLPIKWRSVDIDAFIKGESKQFDYERVVFIVAMAIYMSVALYFGLKFGAWGDIKSAWAKQAALKKVKSE